MRASELFKSFSFGKRPSLRWFGRSAQSGLFLSCPQPVTLSCAICGEGDRPDPLPMPHRGGFTPVPARFPSGVVTFLFTDIEGSTKLWERSPDVMRDALSDHDRILRDAVAANEGVVFKAVGDAFCCAFAVPEKAVRASIDAQRSLQGRQWPGDLGGLRVRTGIHSGSAVQRDDDYFGPTLNRTARLMSIAYGEQILVSAATEALLRDVLTDDVSLRDLGTHRLKDLSRPENAYQVVAPGIRTEFPALNTLDSRPNNLPSQASSFIGRETELAELCQLVRERRVVTITGPGGMGKTRTSLQVAAALLDEYPDGAWFVDLSGLKDASLVAQSIGATLGISELPNETMRATLLDELREKRLLLVIDNAEHLIAEVTAVVGDLVARCPGMSLLVTSREPLHVAGEQVYRLEPMSSAPGRHGALGAGEARCDAALPRTSARDRAEAVAERRRRYGDRLALPPARRHPARHRARGRARESALRATARPAPGGGPGRARGARRGRRSPSHARGDDRLELSAARRRGEAPLRVHQHLQRRLHAGGVRGDRAGGVAVGAGAGRAAVARGQVARDGCDQRPYALYNARGDSRVRRFASEIEGCVHLAAGITFHVLSGAGEPVSRRRRRCRAK